MGINSFPATGGGSGEINEMLIDPVSKFRTSQPENLIDTDFEYGLQPTKWETVEIINNTPAFFSKGGDTTIPDIIGIVTNAGTREITVTTSFPHNLAVGIPIRVDGTKSVTADGSYIINATPSLTTFTYLCRANQLATESIFDLYTSIITGEFFQGSQISLSDSEGIVTDGLGPNSELTVKTKNKHGFGLNTPFYFLNLNSTIAQEFEAQNTASVSFDPTNSSVAQTFDGSNSQQQIAIDFSNKATTAVIQSPITSSSIPNSTITVNLNSAIWSTLKIGSPLYYNVSSSSGFFNTNPRGVVFIKNIDGINQGAGTATFQVSQVPNGPAISLTSAVSGYFKLANLASTFAGNNVDPITQVTIPIEVGPEFVFDGGNQGYSGPNDPDAVSTTITTTGVSGTSITATGQSGLDYYVGSMLLYSTTGTAYTGLTNNTTYFVKTVSAVGGTYTLTVAALPTGSAISVSGGTGTHTFKPIGVSLDRNIVHIKNADFSVFDMVEYTFPTVDGSGNPIDGAFVSNQDKKFYYVLEKYDAHNFVLNELLGSISPLTQTRTGTNAGTAITPTSVTITGFTQPYSWAVTSGTLPIGLTLNTTTGVVSGTPTQETATRTVVITLTDANGLTASQTHTYQFNPAPSLYAFTTATFTTGGVTGRTGPNITQARSGVNQPAWSGTYLNMTTNGVQTWTVPETATYRITARGAQGGATAGGQGTIIRVDVPLTQNSTLNLVVGQRGVDAGGSGAGGGGGSFVYTGTIGGNGLLLAAGGGGGQDDGGSSGAGPNPNLNPGLDGTSGSNLNNGSNGTGGYEDGQGWLGTIPSLAFVGGRFSGTSNQGNSAGAGGFGGGGDSTDDGGGAGGFTGGSSTTSAGGGNGGSYYAGLSVSGGYTSTWAASVTNFVYEGGNNGEGSITITKL